MFNSPIKQILFDKLVEIGRLTSDPHESTIQTINDISDSEALKLLKSVGGGPTIQKNMGGMANMDYMTRPIHMNSGGDPKDRLELEGLLKSLRFSLMLAQGTGTPSFLGGGSSQQIRDLEKQIRQIELMLGE